MNYRRFFSLCLLMVLVTVGCREESARDKNQSPAEMAQRSLSLFNRRQLVGLDQLLCARDTERLVYTLPEDLRFDAITCNEHDSRVVCTVNTEQSGVIISTGQEISFTVIDNKLCELQLHNELALAPYLN